MKITIEGFDCAGKTTQAQNVVTMLQDYYTMTPKLLVEPDNETPFGIKLRDLTKTYMTQLDPFELTCLFSAARRALLKRVKEYESSNRYNAFVFDRSWLSTIAYQDTGRMQRSDIDNIVNATFVGFQELRFPDIVIYIDITFDTFKLRARDDFDKTVTKSFFNEVLKNYIQLFRMLQKIGKTTVITVNGNQNKHAVAKEIETKLIQYFDKV